VPTTRRSDHITPILKNLHWLPISLRIDYKIASITYKTLQSKQPSYLFKILTPYSSVRNLRSSDHRLLAVPFTKTEIGRRAFSYSAPTVWNTLPLSLRSSTSSHSFHRALKTFLFPP
jgi:hypothetical protein